MESACRPDVILEACPGVPLRLADVNTLRVPVVVNSIYDTLRVDWVGKSGVGETQMFAL